MAPALRWAAIAVAALLVAGRLVSVFTVAANWDEFALLDRADATLESGRLETGGRPGLGVLVLLPFVEKCQNEIEVIRHARLLWVAVTVLFVAGLGALLFQLQPDPRRREGDAALGIGLLALVPAFLEWSVQVRTDQLALAGGVWGGVALLASRRRPWLAAVAGFALGLGFLCSQKLAYVALLVGLLAVGQQLVLRELRPGRDLLRAALCCAAFAACLFAFGEVVEVLFAVPDKHVSQSVVSPTQVARTLSLFDYYRATLGWSQYTTLLPTLVPHGVLLVALGAASVAALRARRDRVRTAWAWVLLAAGLGVGWFHAGAFAYFWMTLGLFPAVAFAWTREPIARLLDGFPQRRAVVAGFWIALVAPGLAQSALLLADSQQVQRESFDFVHRNFSRQDVGFHPEKGLFCQEGGPPIQIHFSQTIYRRFGGRWREANTEKMMRTFRDEPIAFVLQSFRLNQFPVELRRFWADNYQPYRASVFLAGRHFRGGVGSAEAFELIVPGAYRWLPFSGAPTVAIDGRDMRAGEVVSLTAGEHQVRFEQDGTDGIFVLAVGDPPDGDAPRRFYKTY